MKICCAAVLSAEQRDAAQHHEQGEERRVVHRGRSAPGQEGPGPGAPAAEPGRRGKHMLIRAS